MEETPADLLHRLVFELDRSADRLLRARFAISYRRARFLFALQARGTVTQHDLATALGFSDPAISTMVQSLAEDGYVQTARSPDHGRKRLVSLTPEGIDIVTKGRRMLDDEFNALVRSAKIDLQHYTEETQTLYQTLVRKEDVHER